MILLNMKEIAEKPREKAMRFGMKHLSDTELLALLIASGDMNSSAFDLAMQVLSKAGDIKQLPQMAYKDYIAIKGIGQVKALRLLACVELSRRFNYRLDNTKTKLMKPADVFLYLGNRYENEVQEKLVCLFLDSQNRIIAEREVFVGSLNRSLVNPREIVKFALELNSASVVMIHNHPSGDPSPSLQDEEVTSIVLQALRVVGIDLFDHVIIGRGCYYSFLKSFREGEQFSYAISF